MEHNAQTFTSGDSKSLQELVQSARSTLNDRIWRLTQVSQITGRAKSTIWKDISKGIFPPPIRLGPRAVGWKNSEIQGWLEARSISSRSKQSIDMKEFVSMLTAPQDLGAKK